MLILQIFMAHVENLILALEEEKHRNFLKK